MESRRWTVGSTAAFLILGAWIPRSAGAAQTGIPPITDLQMIERDVDHVTFSFTAPPAEPGSVPYFRLYHAADPIQPYAYELPADYGYAEGTFTPPTVRIGTLPPWDLYWMIRYPTPGGWSPNSNVLHVHFGGDTIPPGGIPDLRVVQTGESTVVLQWSDPHDDGSNVSSGPVSRRVIKASPADPAGSATPALWFDQEGEEVAGTPPLLGAPGLIVSMVTIHLAPDTLYYFAIQTCDEDENWSAISNVASARTLQPAPAQGGEAPAYCGASSSGPVSWTAGAILLLSTIARRATTR